jgi:precorrin-2 dehydrogenase / sirohydrochlorin ferrochelatase
MIPIHLDPKAASIALIGRAALTVRRLGWLREGGAEPDVWSDAPAPGLAGAAPVLIPRLPDSDELARYHVIWIADLEPELAQRLADGARAYRVLVNVEDVLPLCDFHTPALVRRGRLTVSAGTGGASPALARAARQTIAQAFPEDWAEALEEVAAARTALRATGAGIGAVMDDAQARLARRGLAPDPGAPQA